MTKPSLAVLALSAAVSLAGVMPAAAATGFAPAPLVLVAGQEDGWHQYRTRNGHTYYGNRNYYRNGAYSGPVWRGRDGRYYCRRNDGTTGLLIGGAVGGLVGNGIAGHGDRTLGTILGVAGGALLGREIDRSGSHCN
jgi:outer membrane lipoprotein SlyB